MCLSVCVLTTIRDDLPACYGACAETKNRYVPKWATQNMWHLQEGVRVCIWVMCFDRKGVHSKREQQRANIFSISPFFHNQRSNQRYFMLDFIILHSIHHQMGMCFQFDGGKKTLLYFSVTKGIPFLVGFWFRRGYSILRTFNCILETCKFRHLFHFWQYHFHQSKLQLDRKIIYRQKVFICLVLLLQLLQLRHVVWIIF